MRYDEIKQHVREYFRNMLTQFKEGLAAEGPPSADKLAKIHARQRLTELDLDAFLTKQAHGGTAQGLVTAFCEKRGIAEGALTDRSREWLVQLIHAAHATAVRASSRIMRVGALSDPAAPSARIPSISPPS